MHLLKNEIIKETKIKSKERKSKITVKILILFYFILFCLNFVIYFMLFFNFILVSVNVKFIPVLNYQCVFTFIFIGFSPTHIVCLGQKFIKLFFTF